MASSAFHRQLSMDKRPVDAWLRTAGLNAAITPDDVGKALSLDSAANTFKLAADGDIIVARLDHVEVDADGDSAGWGTIAMSFIETLPVKTGETVSLGDSVLGAGGGEVKAAETADLTDNYVVEVRTGFVVVVKK